MGNQGYAITAVTKALRVLKLFDETHRTMSLTEISALSGLTKSSVLRILESLESEGFVRRVEENKRYRLGPTLFVIAHTGYEFSSLVELANPLLKKVVNETGLTGHLGVLEEEQVLFASCIYPEVSYERYVIASSVGAKLPCHCTGVGKVLLAYAEEPIRTHMLEQCDFKQYTPNTILTREKLELELDVIRRQGYAVNCEEHEPYVTCLTYPVFNYKRRIVAAVSLTGLTQVVNGKDQTLLHSSLQALSAKIGHECVV